MSLQASLLKPVLRVVGRTLTRNPDPVAIRKSIAQSAKRMPPLPPLVSMDITSINGVPAAWFDTPGNDPSKVLLYFQYQLIPVLTG